MYYFQTETIDNKAPKKISKLCETRWLIFMPVATVILEQWNPLKTYFSTQTDFTAETVAKLLDDENKLYLTFVKSILQEVNTVNLAFEQTKADITLLYSDLRSMVFSLVGRVLKPSVIAEAGRPGW